MVPRKLRGGELIKKAETVARAPHRARKPTCAAIPSLAPDPLANSHFLVDKLPLVFGSVSQQTPPNRRQAGSGAHANSVG